MGYYLGRRTTARHFRLGIMFGIIVPDIDLVFSVAIYLLTGSLEDAISIHRTVTHSFITYTVILVLAMITTVAGLASERSFTFVVGLWIGTSIHIVLDLFYLSGVQVFYPFGDFISLSPIAYENLSAFWQKFFLGIDYLSDPIFFYIPLSKEIERLQVEAHSRRAKLLRFMTAYAIAINSALLSIGLLSSIKVETFVLWVYIPDVWVLLFSIFSPLIYRKTILHPQFSPYNYYQQF